MFIWCMIQVRALNDNNDKKKHILLILLFIIIIVIILSNYLYIVDGGDRINIGTLTIVEAKLGIEKKKNGKKSAAREGALVTGVL